jgi:hypothetical protein
LIRLVGEELASLRSSEEASVLGRFLHGPTDCAASVEGAGEEASEGGDGNERDEGSM